MNGKIRAIFIKARSVTIGRKARVEGTISGDKVLISRRAEVEDVYGKDIRISEGARAKNIYGADITIEEGARITGDILYTDAIFVEDDVRLVKEPKKVSSLPSPKLDLE